MEGYVAVPVVILDWSSRQLDRMARSSFSAEAQAATAAIDTLDWSKLFVTVCFKIGLDLRIDSSLALLGESLAITDSKKLYDASRSQTSGL